MTRLIASAVVIASLLTLTGCTRYYSVTDPATDKTYYTTDYKTQNGAVQFEDARTGARVSITNSEVLEISKDTYRSGLAAPAAATTKTTVTTPNTTVTTPAN